MWWISLAALLAAALLTALFGRIALPLLRKLKVRQSIREDGPQQHLSKAGTPTMGGLFFLAALVVVAVLLPDKQWPWGVALFSTLAFALIGFLDDSAKLRHHQNLGLRGKQKLAGQFVAVAILLLAHGLTDPQPTVVNFFASGGTWDLGWWYYPIMGVLLVGIVNSVNLTDGLDGLAAGVSVPVFVGLAAVLLSAATRGAGANLAWFSAAMAGCCLGFLLYNHHPAQVFMGDTGSMGLGGAVVGIAIGGDLEFMLLIFSLVYLIEALSVILQVISFQLFHKRIFLMSPLHHHFE